MQKAKLFSLNLRDALHGTIMAVGGAVLSALIELINNGKIPTTWVEFKPVLISGVSAGVIYLSKNFFTNSAGVIGQSESKAPAIIEVPKLNTQSQQ